MSRKTLRMELRTASHSHIISMLEASRERIRKKLLANHENMHTLDLCTGTKVFGLPLGLRGRQSKSLFSVDCWDEVEKEATRQYENSYLFKLYRRL